MLAPSVRHKHGDSPDGYLGSAVPSGWIPERSWEFAPSVEGYPSLSCLIQLYPED